MIVIKLPICWKTCKKGQTEYKSEFVTKSVGIIVTSIFM